jgi:hypothetical protein
VAARFSWIDLDAAFDIHPASGGEDAHIFQMRFQVDF